MAEMSMDPQRLAFERDRLLHGDRNLSWDQATAAATRRIEQENRIAELTAALTGVTVADLIGENEAILNAGGSTDDSWNEYLDGVDYEAESNLLEQQSAYDKAEAEYVASESYKNGQAMVRGLMQANPGMTREQALRIAPLPKRPHGDFRPTRDVSANIADLKASLDRTDALLNGGADE